MKDLTIYILTHNRGELLLETIDSVLSQNCNDFRFVVSDNSSNDETYDLLKKKGYLDKFEYIKRDKEYPSMDHFNLCLSEVKTKYFMLFHDDDVMMPEMVETLYEKINQSDYIAVGCNAFLLKDKLKTTEKVYNLKNDKVLANQEDLILSYCCNQIAVYPGYMYNKDKIGSLTFINDVGKYSDVTWLLRLINQNPFLWVSKTLMYYRIHAGQDSGVPDIDNQLKLISFYKQCNISKKTNKIVDKYSVAIKYIKERQQKSFSSLKFYFICSPFSFFPKVLIRKLLNKY